MTPIDTEHAALLRGIAKNTNNETAKKVYADWLQEHGNPGWVVVLNYPPQDWPVLCNANGERNRNGDHYRLPWLPGWVREPADPKALAQSWRGTVSNPLQRVKLILLAYANDDHVLTHPMETEDED